MELDIDLEDYKKKAKKSTKRKYLGTIKPDKLWMKDKEEWGGTTVSLRLDKSQSLELSELLTEAARETNEIDLTIYPKKRTPTVTVTYANVSDQ